MKTSPVVRIIRCRPLLRLGVLAIGVLLVCEGRGAYASQDDDSGQVAGALAVPVQVVKPARRGMTRPLLMPATLLPEEMADLFAKVSGYVSSVSVDIGSQVRKGDVLLKIDVPEMADEMRQAQAVLEAKRAKVEALRAKVAQTASTIDTTKADVVRYGAEHELSRITMDRHRELHSQNAIPEQALDEAKNEFAVADAQVQIARAKVGRAEAEMKAVEADVKVAEADVAVADANVARFRTLMQYATIRAPFDGIITDRFVDTGSFVRSAAEGETGPLLKIMMTDRLRVALDVPESDTSFVHVGTEVEILVKSSGLEPIKAAVTRTARAIRVETRTMKVEVDLDNSDGRLAPGMYAEVNIMLEIKQQALVIPSKAIRARGDGLFVMIADGTVAKSVPIEIGYDDGIWAEIAGGLSGDEQVIVSAKSTVGDGEAVAWDPPR